MQESNHQTALITGASRGLGLALAKSLAQLGWRLVIDARSPAPLAAAQSELQQWTEVRSIAGDIADPGHRAELVHAAETFGGLDALVNNASVLGPIPLPRLLDYPLDALEYVYRVNVFGPLALLQAAGRTMKPGAAVVNISSDAAVEAYEGWGGYGSSKAALDQLSAVFAAENPQWRVYWVDPGDMRTQMQQEANPEDDISHLPPPEESVPALIALIENRYPGGHYQARSIERVFTSEPEEET